jgi:hypothetical protein
VVGSSVALLLYLFYQYVSGLRSDEREIRSVEQIELHLAHILRLLEAPDVRLLMEVPTSRQALLLEFSDCLRKDVLALLRAKALGMTSLLMVGVFFLSYYLIRFKARLMCNRNDLRFLSGLELALLRTLNEA